MTKLIGLTRRHVIGAGAGAVTAAAFPFGGIADAQGAWPNKPIRIVSGYPAGGQTDLFARSYGDYVSRQVGQPVLVENKAGAVGTLGAPEVKARMAQLMAEPSPTTPDQFSAFVRAELAKYGPVVKASGAKVD